MKKIVFYILATLFTGILFGQNEIRELPAEKIFLCCDRNLYCPGEQIIYSIYSDGISEIVYVDLFNENGAFTLSQSVIPVNNKYQGIINIPPNIPPGAYTLRAYTYYQQNFDAAEFSSVPIQILSGNVDEIQYVNQSGKSLIKDEAFPVAEIKMKQDTYHQREKAVVDIQPVASRGENIVMMTVSVVKKGAGIKSGSYNTTKTTEGNPLMFPEIKDPVIHGFIKDQSNSNLNLYLSEPGSEQGLRIATSDQNGYFYFPVLPYSGEKTFAITTEPGNNTDSLMILPNTSKKFPAPDTTIKPSQQLAKDMLRNTAVKQSFIKEQAIDTKHPEHVNGLPGDSRYSIRLEDFIALNTLREVFTEIAPYVKVRNEDGFESLAVLDDRRDILYRNPLILLDGTPVFDFEELNKIHPSKVESIDVINRRYLYGSHSLDGLIMIQSKTNDFGGYNFKDKTVFFSLKGIEPLRYAAIASPDKYNTKNPMPDFRTTLYWNGDFTANEYSGRVEFYTSDDIGEYDIIVTGITENGMLYTNRESFTVIKGE